MTVAPHLRWWPVESMPAPFQQILNQQVFTQQFRAEWVPFVVFALYPIIFAGLAGYFVCLWPGSRPTRRVLCSVCVPAAFGIVLICGRFLYIVTRPTSVLESGSNTVRDAHSWAAMLWRLGPGLHFCLLGILLIAIFTSRMAFGIAKLPISFSKRNVPISENSERWRRLRILIWVFVGPLFLLVALPSVSTLWIPSSLLGHLVEYLQSDWFPRLAPIIEALIFLGITFWIIGPDGRQAVRQSIRMPEPKYLFLGLLFPIGISVLISNGNYLIDRAQWAARDFGRYSPPQFESYFSLPDPWLLVMFFAAFSEEVIFRGLLQPQFNRRYGAYRGIFFVSTVWAAFHFSSDSYSGASDLGVLRILTVRVFFCLALGFVLGWLTLRSRSILPATIAHTLANVMAFSNFGPSFPGKDKLRSLLWAGLAYILFRYWPVKEEDEPGAVAAVVEPEPATRKLMSRCQLATVRRNLGV